LRERVARKLRDGAFLFDGDRVHLRSLARCARAASNYRGRPELGAWLDGIVDAALADLLREDDECVRRGGAPHAMDGAGDGGEPAPESTPRSTRKNSGAFAELSLPLQLDPRALAFACHAFNRLPDGERRAFFELVVEGRTLDALAGEKGGATSIARRARRALCTLLSIDEHEAMPAERDATSPSPCEPRDGRGGSTS
jgi:DNA-directed RNA polymerase specialized sigma24 family protein